MGRPSPLRNATITTVLICTAVATVSHAPHIALTTLGVTVLTAGPVLAREGLRQRRLVRALTAITCPGELQGIGVRLGPLDGAAFVAGLAAPRIFCDDRLPDILSPDEQQAVALHEHAHQVARDPLRMALVAVVAPVARRFPTGAAWLERQAASREIAADRAALSRGASRTAIASALLKVGPLHPAGVPGFAPAVDLRLEALLDGEQPGSGRWAGKLTGLGLAASLCVVTLPHGTPTVLGSLCF